MDTRITRAIAGVLPRQLKGKAAPALAIVDQILVGTDNASRSQRLAAIAFVVRIAGALIASAAMSQRRIAVTPNTASGRNHT